MIFFPGTFKSKKMMGSLGRKMKMKIYCIKNQGFEPINSIFSTINPLRLLIIIIMMKICLVLDSRIFYYLFVGLGGLGV